MTQVRICKFAFLSFLLVFCTVFLLPIPVAEAQAPALHFLPAMTFDTAGSGPSSMAVADLDGDGKADLVVANTFSSAVSVLLGNGDGTFKQAVSYFSGGMYAQSVTVADVNGDGRPDLIVANRCADSQCSGSVGVLLGNGNGTFQPAVTYPSGGISAWSVAAADLNGDSKPDVVVVNADSNTIGVLLNNGDGTFHPAASFAISGYSARSVAIGDVNGDGKPDVVVAAICLFNNCYPYSWGVINVLLGDGHGAFQPPMTFLTGGNNSVFVTLADVNRDGILDVLADNAGDSPQSTVGVLLGHGDGTFQPAVTYSTGQMGFGSVAVADLNGDGNADIAVGAIVGHSVGTLLGKGDGTFQSASLFDSGGYGAASVAIFDLNNDQRPDVIVANEDTNTVGILVRGGDTPTTTTLTSAPNPSIFGQAVTFAATVTSSEGQPTRTVTFSDRTTALGQAMLQNGSGAITVSGLTRTGAGSVPHMIAAAYQGDLQFAPSASAALNQAVNQASTTTSLSSSTNPGHVNDTVRYTAVVHSQYGGNTSGRVVFKDANTVIATVNLAGGRAACTQTYRVPGVHSITATYGGDWNNTSSSAGLSENIIP